jgi:predicted  nucleic acid-binding Zn-ribbon protein
LEVALKALYLFLAILLCSTPLHAEKFSIQTELEQMQEKIWYLQRDIGKNKISIEEQQKQFKLLSSSISKEQKQLNESFTTLTQGNAERNEKSKQMESDLVKLGEALIALTAEVRQQNNLFVDQTEKINALEKSVAELRGERLAQQTGTGQELNAFRDQLTEIRTKNGDIRSQLDVMGGQVKQLGYWGAGVAMFISIVLTVVIFLFKNRGGHN